jgi:hypothetical protein
MKKFISGLITSIVVFVPFAASAATTSISHSLSVGSRGEEVMALQGLLAKLGLLKSAPTGYFGNLTRVAVISFQRANGLSPVGTVGPKTRILVNAALAHLNAPAQPAATTTPAAPVAPPPPASPPATTPVMTPPPPPPAAPTVSPDAPPVVTLISPQSVISKTTTDFEFAVATDKPSTCRYGTQTGMTLPYMTSFVDSSGTRHARVLTGLSTGGLYIYYVKCEDLQGRLSNELVVTFSLTGE